MGYYETRFLDFGERIIHLKSILFLTSGKCPGQLFLRVCPQSLYVFICLADVSFFCLFKTLFMYATPEFAALRLSVLRRSSVLVVFLSIS